VAQKANAEAVESRETMQVTMKVAKPHGTEMITIHAPDLLAGRRQRRREPGSRMPNLDDSRVTEVLPAQPC
jgi:hypothetical protein